jgi:probable HAF family extracellular repeat protein
MRIKIASLVLFLCAFAALAIPTRIHGQKEKRLHLQYMLIDLGSTFGGPQSYLVPGSGIDFPGSSVLNSAGRVVGYADTSEPDPFPNFCFNQDCFVSHAFQSRSGATTDLGTLPGGGSGVPMWISANGLIAGLSENGETDPLYAGLPQLHAVLWQQDKITDLGTLPEGGYQSVATAMNSSGQVVGAALNTIPDANSMQQAPIGPGAFWLWGGITPPYLYQMRAFLWDKQDGMQDLGTLPGGTDAQAIMINESGQVIGFSYTASTQPGACFALATNSFIWEKGKGMTDLGGFGGTCTLATALNSKGQIVGEGFRTGDQSAPAFLWEKGLLHELGGSLGGDATGAFAINDLGEAVGFGNLPGNNTFHATLWKNVDSITDLGAIGSDQCSFAGAINARGQIVGSSLSNCNGDTGIVRAILYEDGSLFDLNTLIPADSALSLQYAHAINDRGEISGTAVDANANLHAFLLIPCDENHPNIERCDHSLVDPPIGEVRENLTQNENASSGNPTLESGPPQMLGSLSSDKSNSLNRFRHRLASRPSLKNQQSASSTPSVGLTITSGAPPNGELGVSYGPSTTEYLKCYASPILGWHQVCTPCSSFSSGCVSLPPCRGLFPSPCVKTEVVYLGVVLAATGGVSPYAWSASGLPPGLSLNSQKGLISGIPIGAGSYNLTVNVHDSAPTPKSASAHYIIRISP